MKKKSAKYLLHIFMYRNFYIGKVFIHMIFRINDFTNTLFHVKTLMVYYKNTVDLSVSADIIFYELAYT